MSLFTINLIPHADQSQNFYIVISEVEDAKDSDVCIVRSHIQFLIDLPIFAVVLFHVAIS